MQNKHRNFFPLRCPNFRGGGGGPPVGPKDQLFPFFFKASFSNYLDLSWCGIVSNSKNRTDWIWYIREWCHERYYICYKRRKGFISERKGNGILASCPQHSWWGRSDILGGLPGGQATLYVKNIWSTTTMMRRRIVMGNKFAWYIFWRGWTL